ncbi:sugar phosphate permease [Microbacterium sp. AG790]|uniref:MFS transporter n=1 Tax=Microbacterium sp. AG790 TaxID=2183995 RepID=UPI000EB30493|nr:MFS transporter [Microbacterium sp. AG790]RKS90201.1 sugar phosphate permease [Microbacterium sp. AG790]
MPSTNTTTATPTRAWLMLALGVLAQAAGTLLVSAPAYLIPLLHTHRAMPLAQAGLLASAPTLGMVCTLVVWGVLTDRYGERQIIAGGLVLTAVFSLAAAAASSDGYVAFGVLLACGGAASASTNAASGRVVIGWFPVQRRGLAMGIRQMSQPLGVATAALTVPPLAEGGLAAPFVVAAGVTGALAVLCAWGIRNPPRPARRIGPADAATNPYRGSAFLVRIHLASALLVVPQFVLSIFGLVWLVTAMGWSAAAAGALVAASQFVGAVGRIVVGHLSDRVGTRVGVLRWVAGAGVVAMAALAAAGAVHADALVGVLYLVASTIAVADNGLAYTSVAEAAGPFWSGRALGIQNTGQFVAASAVGPLVGALITLVGYPLAFALVGSTPLAALAITPRRDRGMHR